MIIIEFCGSPGCGKSTLCTKIHEHYRNQHMDIVGSEEFESVLVPFRAQNNNFIKSAYHIYLQMKIILFRYTKKYSRLMSAFCTRADAKVDDRWANEIYKMDYYLHALRKKDIVILDEGILQFITSISHGKKLNPLYVPLINKIERSIYTFPTIIFHCDLNISENVKRIRERKRDDRFFRLSDEELPKQLSSKAENINMVVKALQSCKVIDINVMDFDVAYKAIIEEIDNFLREN